MNFVVWVYCVYTYNDNKLLLLLKCGARNFHAQNLRYTDASILSMGRKQRGVDTTSEVSEIRAKAGFLITTYYAKVGQ